MWYTLDNVSVFLFNHSTQKLGKSDSKSSEDDEEEGSSDSDEDLDSPQVIRQAPATSSTTAAGAETMEVDSSDSKLSKLTSSGHLTLAAGGLSSDVRFWRQQTSDCDV